MTTCADVYLAIACYGQLPRHLLPDWALDPLTEDEFNLAIAIIGVEEGITPICEDGYLVAWKGIGITKEAHDV